MSPATHPRADAGGPDDFLPIRTLDLEISAPLPSIQSVESLSSERYGSAVVLVRFHTQPLGIVKVVLPPEGLEPDQLAKLIWEQLGDRIAALPSLTQQPIVALHAQGLPHQAQSDYRGTRAAALRASPPVAIVICTRDRPERLRDCLAAVAEQDHPPFEVIVVDNAPSTNATSALVQELQDRIPVRRVLEPLPGLARARNAAIAATRADIVAFIDDDELPDAHWLSELTLGFSEGNDVGCVTGMILPAKLETRAQAWFEEYGGHSKNRGFAQQIFDTKDPGSQHPLYPLPPFGAGGNMAFRRQALIAAGGFDPALGAGTPTKGAEDTAAFADVMLLGYRLVYRPSAFVWHNHYQEFDDLRNQLFGYGSGLTTYFVRLVMRRPRALPQLLSLLPRGLRDLTGRESQRFASMDAAFPAELLAAHRRGMAWGLIAYPRTLWQQRHVPRATFDVE